MSGSSAGWVRTQNGGGTTGLTEAEVIIILILLGCVGRSLSCGVVCDSTPPLLSSHGGVTRTQPEIVLQRCAFSRVEINLGNWGVVLSVVPGLLNDSLSDDFINWLH